MAEINIVVMIIELREFIKEAEEREDAVRGSLYASKEVARRLRAIIVGDSSPAPPPEDNWVNPWDSAGIRGGPELSSSRESTPDSMSEYFYREEELGISND